jgi:lipopolysaccharide/colanic/teichoic acid biosynthesis glycosyltransferase
MAFFLWVLGRIYGRNLTTPDVVRTGFVLFVAVDALVSLLRRRDLPVVSGARTEQTLRPESIRDNQASGLGNNPVGFSSIDTVAVIQKIRGVLEEQLVEFIENNLPTLQGGSGDVMFLDGVAPTDEQYKSLPVGLLVSRIRMNDVRRLNKYFLSCFERILPEGYFAGRYIPLENIEKRLRRRFAGFLYYPIAILHFLWYRVFPKIPRLNAFYFVLTKGRNRVLSKTEVWGRLSSCGMRVIAETGGDGEVFLIAKRVALPVQRKKPSYYPVISLERVGLDGEMINSHKIRTMYPFSEFLQKRVFDDNALAPTGKFLDDYRITGYGRFLRKYWLDEIPQILDWWRGDIKLVGIRAMSRHYFSLYPRDFQDLYIQVKPGLVPPIFNESTVGFDQIVEVDRKYLQRYRQFPVLTDVCYLFQTFKDIVFKGVRSH